MLIAGAGAGGAAAAWALAAKGVKVVLLDAGPRFTNDQYNNSEDDWEAAGFPSGPGSQGRYELVTGQPLKDKWSNLRNLSAPRRRRNSRTHRTGRSYMHVRGVGGSTLHYTGWTHRLHPHSFEMKTRFGVAADWGISYGELEPYYTRAEYLIGVAGPASVPGRPMSKSFPTPAHPLCFHSQHIAKAAGKFGITVHPNPISAPSSIWAGRPQCNYCGCCHKGCQRGDKGSSDLVFVGPAEETGNCVVFANHTLVDIRKGEDDRLKSAVVASLDGARHEIKFEHIIVAAGAVETPRLLLAMDGLGNESGQVGRNFMETLGLGITGLAQVQIGSHRGFPEDSISWDFSRPGSIPDNPGGAILTPGVISADYHGPARYADRLLEGFGTGFKRKLAEDFGKAAGINVICENLPNPRSFVDLSDTATDHTGHPIARINSYLPELELERLSFMAQKAEAILKEAGVVEVQDRFSTFEQFAAAHVMGTCRMGADPEHSVVNTQLRSHRWQNLWICDASVFASSGSGEGPTLTLHALALRLADAITASKGNAA